MPKSLKSVCKPPEERNPGAANKVRLRCGSEELSLGTVRKVDAALDVKGTAKIRKMMIRKLLAKMALPSVSLRCETVHL